MVGCHEGTMSSLVKKFIPFIPDLEIVLLIETSNAKSIKRDIKNRFSCNRVVNINGSKSSFFDIEEEYLKEYTMEVYQKLRDEC